MGVALKFYACVGSNHTTLDALRALQAQHRFGAQDVERIVVHGSQVTADHVGWKYEPAGMTAAQLNLPFCVATLLLEGDCFVEQFEPGVESDARRMALAERVTVLADPAITARGAKHRHAVRVEVELRDGRRLKGAQEAPRGSDELFATDGEIVAKFEKLASRTLPAKRVNELRDAVLRLEQLGDAAQLAALLAQ
jgi:2-methylcitrate dehydratase PrpD